MDDEQDQVQTGRYTVKEHTARKLVAEATRPPLVNIAAIWAIFVPITLVIAPWRGGTPLLITLVAALILLAISALIVRLVPRLERLVVDIEVGEYRVEQLYLLPRGVRSVRIPLASVTCVRCRRRLWQDGPETEATRWAIELTDEEGTTWRMAEDEEREPMQELARLVAEVSGRPLLNTDT